MHRPVRRLRVVASADDGRDQLLAMVEAEVGALVGLLPAPVLVTSEAGIVLRANPAAAMALGAREAALVGKAVDELLAGLTVTPRVRTLCHSGEVLRLYVW
ncbi:MAG: PAS domain-containing protein [Chloroflexi bacterium]|nr:PAS domain-containing protein [Chloroflexota bacterium]